MKLYKLPDAPAGHRWLSHKTGLRNFDEVELPKEGRQGMADFLNANEVEAQFAWDKQQHPEEYDPLHEAEQRAIAAAGVPSGTVDQPSAGACSTCGRDYGYGHYESAMSARTSLAQIDAGMCAKAIGQMHGAELAKIVSAAIERMQELVTQVVPDVQTADM